MRLAILSTALLLASGGAYAQNNNSVDAEKAAYQKVCSRCHPTEMADGIRSLPDWKETINTMKGLGAEGTDQEFEQLLTFLLRNQTKININTATEREIALVLDIGDTAAHAVVERRTSKGKFATLDELKALPGMDAKNIDARKDRITF